MKKSNQVGRPPVEEDKKNKSRYILRLSIEEKAIIHAHIQKYEALLGRQGVSISEYIRTILPIINKDSTKLAPGLSNRSARKDTSLFFCNDQEWDNIGTLSNTLQLSKNDLLTSLALSGLTANILKD